ncbi:MAG: outer membrane protein assembly factor BamB [Rubrivivax sp.]
MLATLATHRLRRAVVAGAGALLLSLLAVGCSSDRPKPSPLLDYVPRADARQVWQAKLDSVKFPMVISARGGVFVVAGTDGTVLSLDAATGRELWRTSAGAELTAGVGSDGRFQSVVTRDNILVTFENGKEIWRQRLSARVSTAPLVGGERVFVMGVDRAIAAFDALDGTRLWSLQRPGDALTLLNTGVLTGVKDTLVAGQGPRMIGVDPNLGTLRWEIALASPRGVNEVERLADLVGPSVRFGTTVCARSYQAGVGCADAALGKVLWARPAGGINAVGGNSERIYGADAVDRIVAWRADNGETVWSSEKLQYRGLSAPASVGKTVAFGDLEGIVHFLDPDSGETLLRLATDGSPVVGAPAVLDDTLLVVTRNGGLFAFRGGRTN